MVHEVAKPLVGQPIGRAKAGSRLGECTIHIPSPPRFEYDRKPCDTCNNATVLTSAEIPAFQIWETDIAP